MDMTFLSMMLTAAVIDSINPCELAVLTLLLATIVGAGERLRVIGAGLAFTSAIFISYFLMGLGLFTAIKTTGLAYMFYFVVSVFALIIGGLNVKAFFVHKPGGWSVEIPLRWRPYVKKVIKGVTSIPGAFLIGFVISLTLIPCSSGPYIIVLAMMANMVSGLAAIGLLLVYNFIFVLPMIIITLAVYFGLTTPKKATEWRMKRIRQLHLIAGILMICLGIVMLISLWMGWI